MAAVDEIMTWNQESKRWFKKHNKKQVGIKASKLAKLYPELVTGLTQAGSRKAANRWWQEKLSELQSTPEVHPEQDAIERLEAIRSHLESTGDTLAAEKIKDHIRIATASDGKPRNGTLGDEFLLRPELPIGQALLTLSASHEVELLKKKLDVKTASGMDCKSNADIWLESKLTKVAGKKRTAGHYDNLRRELYAFLAWFGAEKSVTDINGLVFQQYHDHLEQQINAGKFKETSAKRLQGTLKAWITWLYGVEKLDKLPRNLKHDDFKFKIKHAEPIPWTKEELHMVLPFAEGKPMKLYLLLMLNCGFTQVDIAELEHTMVDWKLGTITSQRGKTSAKSENVPCVTFPLWPSTFKLLKQYRSSDPKFVLVNEVGKQLRREELVNGKYKKQDVIQSQYYDLKLAVLAKNPDWKPKVLKQLRKTGPSLLRGTKYDSVYQLFLRHASESIADKHYAASPAKLLTEAVIWLGQELNLA